MPGFVAGALSCFVGRIGFAVDNPPSLRSISSGMFYSLSEKFCFSLNSHDAHALEKGITNNVSGRRSTLFYLPDRSAARRRKTHPYAQWRDMDGG